MILWRNDVIYLIQIIMILLGIAFVGILVYVLIQPNIVYVNELFIRAHFTHNKIDKICIEYLPHYKYTSVKVSYIVFYDTNGNRYVCTSYEYPKEITVDMYRTDIESTVAHILGNNNITVTYAANQKSGKLFLRAE